MISRWWHRVMLASLFLGLTCYIVVGAIIIIRGGS